MMLVSKPLGGLFSVPDLGLSAVLSKNTTKEEKEKSQRRRNTFTVERGLSDLTKIIFIEVNFRGQIHAGKRYCGRYARNQFCLA